MSKSINSIIVNNNDYKEVSMNGRAETVGSFDIVSTNNSNIQMRISHISEFKTIYLIMLFLRFLMTKIFYQ